MKNYEVRAKHKNFEIRQQNGKRLYTHIGVDAGVTCMPFKWQNNQWEVLVRYEEIPFLNDPSFCLIEGRVDEALSPVETMVKELKEEAGIVIKDESALYDLGASYVFKYCDVGAHFFALDLDAGGFDCLKPLGVDEIDENAGLSWLPINYLNTLKNTPIVPSLCTTILRLKWLHGIDLG